MFNTKSSLQTLLLIAVITATLFTIGCDRSPQTSEELITRVQVHLTGIGGSSFDMEFEAKDDDGDGIFNSIDEIVIPTGTQFNCHLHVYDDTKTPVENITEEIEAENTVHLFVFKSNTMGLSIGSLNTDDNAAPFGLESVWSTAAAANGSVQILLRHEPTDKNNVSDPGGDVDFDVTFPVKIQ